MFKTSEPLYNGELMHTAEESYTERYGNMTNQQIYFSDLARFVHTYLGLICEIWVLFYL